MEAVASGVDRWANRNECAKVGVFVFCLALSGEKWKKHRTKMVVQAPFVLQSKNKSMGNATNLHSKTAVAAQCAGKCKPATMHQPATAVGGAKECQLIEGAACKGNKFALALKERLRQHPAPQPPNRVRKYDRHRKLSTSTIKSQTRSIQPSLLHRPKAERET